MQKELKKLAKSHALGNLPQHTSAAPTQTDRTPGPRTTTPKIAPSNIVGRPPVLTPTTADPVVPEHAPLDLSQKRGKKRELEETTTVSPQQNHRQATPPATVVIGANGVKQRPIKKQRVVRCRRAHESYHKMTSIILKGCSGTGSDERPSVAATTHPPGNLTFAYSLSFPIRLPTFRLLHLST